jgi:hypothetical protein
MNAARKSSRARREPAHVVAVQELQAHVSERQRLAAKNDSLCKVLELDEMLKALRNDARRSKRPKLSADERKRLDCAALNLFGELKESLAIWAGLPKDFLKGGRT